MNWFNLKRNKCPKCSDPKGLLAYYNEHTKNFNCPCGFKISEVKFKAMIQDFERRSHFPTKHYRPSDENPE